MKQQNISTLEGGSTSDNKTYGPATNHKRRIQRQGPEGNCPSAKRLPQAKESKKSIFRTSRQKMSSAESETVTITTEATLRYSDCVTSELFSSAINIKMRTSGGSIEYHSEDCAKPRNEMQIINPNIDRGWAWMVVLASFIMHVLVMGSQMALGILYVEWLEEFNQSRALTAWIGSLTMGISLIVGPLVSFFVDACGCRTTAVFGGIITALGWAMSAYATSVYYLFISFGVVAGIGNGLAYLPNIVMVGQYFQRRRALAQGISTTGTGFGACLVTILLKTLSAEYGWRGTMLIHGAVNLNLCVCGALLRPLSSDKGFVPDLCDMQSCNSKPSESDHPTLAMENQNAGTRKTENKAEGCKENSNRDRVRNASETKWKYKDTKGITLKNIYAIRLFKTLSQCANSVRLGFHFWYSSYFGGESLFQNKVFVAFLFWALFAYCSFVIPFIHLPEIVKQYGLSSENDKFPLTSIIAIFHILGKVILGIICDFPFVSAWNVLLLSNFCLGICILVIPLMHTFINLAIVCAMIGFASGYFSVMPCVTEDLVGLSNLANAYGITICANGVSALLGPPFAAVQPSKMLLTTRGFVDRINPVWF
ncbi:monocarboxylate transporter 14-like isoform X2 [Scyliorhinus canicula]|uniref:monocarboxylate transporter 14-like isoform X2 n=1 Tax=Scyliorhinus canicula TaxID=7830 RepID=UPI0018F6B69C|nr:monocarboxylate transporter 14-like isoform X2 [Scyliorhinus canicula]